MKGAEQLARSCRRLGREGVGAGRAGTRTGTGTGTGTRARARPRAASRLRAASAGRAALRGRGRGGSRGSRFSPSSVCFLEAHGPLSGGGLPTFPPLASPGFLCFLHLGMCLAIVVACVINCTRAFPCSLRESGLNWL